MEGYKPQDFSFFHCSEKLVQQEILGIDNIIKAGIDAGDKKYIKIYSEDGYKYAEGLNRQ